MNSSYLDWNYNDPELAVEGTILHGFEFIFARLAPIAFLVYVIVPVGYIMPQKVLRERKKNQCCQHFWRPFGFFS